MKFLLDSHVFLWVLNDPDMLGDKTTALLGADNSQLLVSVVSIWELGLKYKKKKQPYSITEMFSGVQALNAGLLHLVASHLVSFETTNLIHKDPFDTLLVAQSETESCTFVTVDKNILRSNYRTLNAEQ